jgi:hypothetical protein
LTASRWRLSAIATQERHATRGSRAVTPELVRHVQYRYEETDEPVASIAADCDLIERTI